MDLVIHNTLYDIGVPHQQNGVQFKGTYMRMNVCAHDLYMMWGKSICGVKFTGSPYINIYILGKYFSRRPHFVRRGRSQRMCVVPPD